MDKKKLQPLTLKWLEQRFPNFFEHSPTWVGEHGSNNDPILRPIGDFWQ